MGAYPDFQIGRAGCAWQKIWSSKSKSSRQVCSCGFSPVFFRIRAEMTRVFQDLKNRSFIITFSQILRARKNWTNVIIKSERDEISAKKCRTLLFSTGPPKLKRLLSLRIFSTYGNWMFSREKVLYIQLLWQFLIQNQHCSVTLSVFLQHNVIRRSNQILKKGFSTLSEPAFFLLFRLCRLHLILEKNSNWDGNRAKLPKFTITTYGAVLDLEISI